MATAKWNFVKFINKVLQGWRNYEKFQSSTFDTLARRKLIEDQNTILELSGRVQKLQNEVNCMNDSKDFQDAESVRSGTSHVTSRPVSFPPHPIPETLRRIMGQTNNDCRFLISTLTSSLHQQPLLAGR